MADINGINFFKHNVISEVSVGKASLKKHIYSEERNVEFQRRILPQYTALRFFRIHMNLFFNTGENYYG